MIPVELGPLNKVLYSVLCTLYSVFYILCTLSSPYIIDGLLLQPEVLCELLPVVELALLGDRAHLGPNVVTARARGEMQDLKRKMQDLKEENTRVSNSS